ncbi:hypothetical protein COBT_002654 [Conglomerata obtusa]
MFSLQFHLCYGIICASEQKRLNREIDFVQITVTDAHGSMYIPIVPEVSKKAQKMSDETSKQINSYIQRLNYNPLKSISSLISYIQSINKYDCQNCAFDNIMHKLFPGFCVKTKNLEDENVPNDLLWTKKILYLILYYAHDFLHDVKLFILMNTRQSKAKVCIELDVRFQDVLSLKNINKIISEFLTIIYCQCSKELLIRHIFDIKLYDLTISKELFCSIFSIIIRKLIKLICEPNDHKYNIRQYRKNSKNMLFIEKVDITLKDLSSYEVFWINNKKHNCLGKEFHFNVQTIDQFIDVFTHALEKVKIANNLDSCMFILFNVDIVQKIIDFIIWNTDILNTIQTNFCDVLKTELFALFYGSSNEIEILAKILLEFENKILRFIEKNGNTSVDESYFYFFTIRIIHSCNIDLKCVEIFDEYLKNFLQPYKFQKEFKDTVFYFYNQYSKTITNILKSINETICSYSEISKDYYIKESHDLTQNILTEILNKKIAIRKTNKTSQDFINNILSDQKKWYDQHNKKAKKALIKQKISQYHLFLKSRDLYNQVLNKKYKAKKNINTTNALEKFQNHKQKQDLSHINDQLVHQTNFQPTKKTEVGDKKKPKAKIINQLEKI